MTGSKDARSAAAATPSVSEALAAWAAGLTWKRLPAEVVGKNWRKNLHRLFRWARKADPAALPALAFSAAKASFALPGAEDYFRFAGRIHRRLEKLRERSR